MTQESVSEAVVSPTGWSLAIPARLLCAMVAFAMAAIVLVISVGDAAAQSSVRPPTGTAQPDADAAGNAQRTWNYDREIWSSVRDGIQGTVSIPDKMAGTLVQSDGEAWRNVRNGALAEYGAYAMAGTLAVLVLFYLIRGRIQIGHGWSGRTIVRFTSLERMGHWLLATSFIILALTGLNILYGRYVLPPLIGKENFALITMFGKWLHNYVAFAFMAGLAITFVLWVLHNIPSWRDIVWVMQGGGFIKGLHPAAWKFNAGQKVLFWLVMLGGVSISLSGIALLFPFQTAMFAKTFGVLNIFGFGLPTDLSPIQEMQYATTWHGIVALFLTCLIIAHIYIGTIGMQGAFDAMGTGEVDVSWAREHHSLWADEVLNKQGSSDTGTGTGSAAGARPAPAE